MGPAYKAVTIYSCSYTCYAKAVPFCYLGQYGASVIHSRGHRRVHVAWPNSSRMWSMLESLDE